MKIVLSLMIILIPSFSPGQSRRGCERHSDKVNVRLTEGTLSNCPLTDYAIRIGFHKDVDVRIPEFVFTSDVRTPGFTVSDSPSRLKVRVKSTVVDLDKHEGRLSFEDTSEVLWYSTGCILHPVVS